MISNPQNLSRCMNDMLPAGSFPSYAARSVMMCDGQARGSGFRPSHVCLDCAMPLHDEHETQAPECHCARFEEVRDDWWDFGGMGPLAAFCIGLICLAIACWSRP